jgi:hypothetical protein
MAGPIANLIILPSDTGNTGKNVRTQTRVVSGNTVHEHFYINTRKAELLGVYRLGLAQQTVSATAQNGTSTGFCWMHVPTAISNKQARIRRIKVDSQHSSALATPTAPRLVFSRFTFTGTASGASAGTPVKIDSAYPASILDLRTAVTGLTVTLVGILGISGITGALTAVGAYSPVGIEPFSDYDSEDNWPIIKPGEGIVIWQDTVGTASDTRKLNISILWDDIDTA